MASFKSYPVFGTLLIVIGVVVAGEAWLSYNRFEAAKKSAVALNQKRNELTSLQAVQPFPSEENKAAVEADLRRTQVALVAMREGLKGRGPAAEELLKARTAYIRAEGMTPEERTKLLHEANVPAEPTDMFFDLASFTEKTRDKVQQAKITIKTDERFSFATYANAGPERDLIPQVFRQRQIVEYLVDALIDAHPSQLLSLQRERPLTKAQRALLAAGQQLPPAPRGAAPGAESDLFEIDPRISAREPGFVVVTSFRLDFIGDTEALRTFLNKLATFELPLVVRSVEVEPAPATTPGGSVPVNPTTLGAIFGTEDTTTAAPVAKPKALVEKVLSKFTVTVEFIDLVATTTAAGATSTS